MTWVPPGRLVLLRCWYGDCSAPGVPETAGSRSDSPRSVHERRTLTFWAMCGPVLSEQWFDSAPRAGGPALRIFCAPEAGDVRGPGCGAVLSDKNTGDPNQRTAGTRRAKTLALSVCSSLRLPCATARPPKSMVRTVAQVETEAGRLSMASNVTSQSLGPPSACNTHATASDAWPSGRRNPSLGKQPSIQKASEESVSNAIARTSRRMFRAWILAASLAACTTQNPEQTEQIKQAAPAAPDVAARTVKTSPDKVANGKRTYEQLCVSCHGENAEGKVGVAPSLASKTYLAAAGDELLIHTIQQGREGTTMPAWGLKVSRFAAEELVAYLRDLNPVERAHLDESPLKADLARGEQVFSNVCSACHGRTGRGYQEAASGTAIRGRAFLSNVTDGFLRYIIKHGKSGTQMKPFRTESKIAVASLTPEDIDSVISYMRKNSH